MDNNTKQTTSNIEQKNTGISRKVWDIGNKGPKSISLNSDGSIPHTAYNSIPRNTIIPTDYKDSTGKLIHLVKINNIAYKIALEGV